MSLGQDTSDMLAILKATAEQLSHLMSPFPQSDSSSLIVHIPVQDDGTSPIGQLVLQVEPRAESPGTSTPTPPTAHSGADGASADAAAKSAAEVAQVAVATADQSATDARSAANSAKGYTHAAQDAATTAEVAARKATGAVQALSRAGGDQRLALAIISLLILAALGIAVMLGPNSSLLLTDRGFWAMVAICATVLLINFVFYAFSVFGSRRLSTEQMQPHTSTIAPS